MTDAACTVGIDLGTTNSLIGTIRDGELVRFADERGEELLPSVVGERGTAIEVGRVARNRRVLAPDRTVVSVKRMMGTQAHFRLADRELTPPEVSALILGSLLDRAEAALGTRPTRAVITVPAYFDDAQRQATSDAGAIAGVEVERLVNEPTAAALGYTSGGEELVLVYDLGGGTFDVSILEHDDGLLEVRSSHGDTHLGGDDIDQALYQWVCDQLGDAAAKSLQRDLAARTRILEAVERAKIALSDRDEVRLFDPFVSGKGADAVHLDLALSRDTLARLARPLVERTLRCIDQTLAGAKVTARQLDRVLLVGGASKMPLVRDLVSEHLDMPASAELDADRAVVNGAALLAGRAMGAEVGGVLVDIAPHTLAAGVVSYDEEGLAAAAVIPRGTVIPVTRTQTYYTQYGGQQKVMVPIAQGESERFTANTPLGEVAITDLPSSSEGAPVEVTFRLDLSGVLHVSAKHVASGKSAETRIANSPYRLTAQERNRAKASLAALREADVDSDTSSSGAREGAAEADLALAKAMVARSERALAALDGDKAHSLTDAVAAVETARAVLVQAIERRLSDVDVKTDDLSDALLDLI